MAVRLKKLSTEDGRDIYEMLQRIGSNENEFKNTAHGLGYNEYKVWLRQQDDWSNGRNLPDGYVAQTIFWLFDESKPVGIGKIRHALNENSRRVGGNVGYAIDPLFRGKGYGTVLIEKLIERARELQVDEILLSVEKNNPISKRVIEKNGGNLVSENDERWFFVFDKEGE